MNKLFEHLSANRFHYRDYEWRTAADAKATPYDPLKRANQLLLEAMEIGMQIMHKAPKEQRNNSRFRLSIRSSGPDVRPTHHKPVYQFQTGLFPEESVHSGRRHGHARLHWPVLSFEPLSVIHYPNGSSINTSDKNSMAIMMTYMNQPEGMVASFFRNYGERYDWMVAVFRDWVFTLVSAFLYYKDKEVGTNPKALELYRQGMAVFDGSAPTYHMELRDKPTFMWDFHSLMMGIKMVLSFRLTDDQHPLRLCDQCQKVFIAKRADSKFCSPECGKKWTASHDKESS